MLSADCAILIPAWNEARTIGRVVAEAGDVVAAVFVVDDGSTDDTGAIARAAGASVLRNVNRGGLGVALSRGFRELDRRGFRCVITCDGDGAHVPSDAHALVASHRSEGADLTIGSRFTGPLAVDVPSPKRAVNSFGAIVVNRVLQTALSDIACGIRVVGPAGLALDVRDSGFGFAFELLSAAVAANLRIVSAPVQVRYDAGRLFATQREELEAFLIYWASHRRTDGAVRVGLEQMLAQVRAMAAMEVRLAGRTFVLHPQRDIGGFIVQEQHPWLKLDATGADERTIISVF